MKIYFFIKKLNSYSLVFIIALAVDISDYFQKSAKISYYIESMERMLFLYKKQTKRSGTEAFPNYHFATLFRNKSN